MKLTKTQEKIIIAAGLDPAEIYPEKVRNVWGSQTPKMITIFTPYGADECKKAMASKDIELLDVHDHDDGFTNYATFCFKSKGAQSGKE